MPSTNQTATSTGPSPKPPPSNANLTSALSSLRLTSSNPGSGYGSGPSSTSLISQRRKSQDLGRTNDLAAPAYLLAYFINTENSDYHRKLMSRRQEREGGNGIGGGGQEKGK